MASALSKDQRLLHLLRRAGFGASPAELAQAQKDGFSKTLDRLLHYNAVAFIVPPPPPATNRGDLRPAQLWWINLLRHSPRPLQEKMALFWHGHFATANYKVGNPDLMVQQNQLFRRYATGNFLDLLLGVYKDPAMLIWLDGATNRKASPNENFARECMELFTIGLGHYTQADVRAAARSLTGWTLEHRTIPRYVPRFHDDTVKTFLGQTGAWTGDDIMRILAGRPETAQFLSNKLFAFFAYDNPSSTVTEPLAKVYLDSHYDIGAVLEALFTSDAFYSPQAVYGHFKSPVEYTVGVLRQLDSPLPLTVLPGYLTAMGQNLFNPPNVGGWPGGPTWMNAATSHVRSVFAELAIRPPFKSVPGFTIPTAWPTDPPAMVQQLAAHLLEPQLRPETLAVLKARAAVIPGASHSVPWQQGVRSLIHLALVAPEYQLG